MLASAVASVATFGGDDGWEMHVQTASRSDQDVELTSGDATWNDVFHCQGAGSGARALAFDGAVELRLDAEPPAPVQVRLRFVPTGAAAAVQEEVRYVTSRQSFAAVDFEVACQPNVVCVNEGTLEVEVVTPSELGASTLLVHWVATTSLSGRGPAAPADALLKLTQP